MNEQRCNGLTLLWGEGLSVEFVLSQQLYRTVKLLFHYGLVWRISLQIVKYWDKHTAVRSRPRTVYSEPSLQVFKAITVVCHKRRSWRRLQHINDRVMLWWEEDECWNSCFALMECTANRAGINHGLALSWFCESQRPCFTATTNLKLLHSNVNSWLRCNHLRTLYYTKLSRANIDSILLVHQPLHSGVVCVGFFLTRVDMCLFIKASSIKYGEYELTSVLLDERYPSA